MLPTNTISSNFTPGVNMLDNELLTPEKFLKESKKDSFFKEVNDSIKHGPIDLETIKLQKEWILYKDQLIGSEDIIYLNLINS